MCSKTFKKKRIIFYCQHSVGIGHLIRSFALVNSLKSTFEVTLISGGVFPNKISIPDKINFIQLPPIGIDENNSLKVQNSREPLHLVMKKRQSLMLNYFKSNKPNIFITEYFPFGKMQFMGELLPVLKFIKTNERNTKIICSSRDILESSTTTNKMYQDFSVKIINDFYDRILVHGDETLIRFGQTFPLSRKLQVPIEYTGYVTNSTQKQKKNRNHFKEVILSAGGGKIAHPFIFKVVKSFISFGFGKGIVLRVIPGPMYPKDKFKFLTDIVKDKPNIILKQTVEDLTSFWVNARLSISSGGYNTLMELISSGIPAIVSPYRNESNSEQEIRSNYLSKKGLIKTMFYENMDEEQISYTVRKALNFQPSNYDVNLKGSSKTREILENIIDVN